MGVAISVQRAQFPRNRRCSSSLRFSAMHCSSFKTWALRKSLSGSGPRPPSTNWEGDAPEMLKLGDLTEKSTRDEARLKPASAERDATNTATVSLGTARAIAATSAESVDKTTAVVSIMTARASCALARLDCSLICCSARATIQSCASSSRLEIVDELSGMLHRGAGLENRLACTTRRMRRQRESLVQGMGMRPARAPPPAIGSGAVFQFACP